MDERRGKKRHWRESERAMACAFESEGKWWAFPYHALRLMQCGPDELTALYGSHIVRVSGRGLEALMEAMQETRALSVPETRGGAGAWESYAERIEVLAVEEEEPPAGA